MRYLLALCVLLVSCGGTTPVHETLSVQQEFATYYLTPDDAIVGEPVALWNLTKMFQNEIYAYRIPKAPWGDLVFATFPRQVDYWFATSDYDKECWSWKLVKSTFGFYPTPNQYSGAGNTYVAMWSENDHAIRIPLYYEVPENYIYATVEQIGCSQPSINTPTTITFWGKNLQGGRDFHIWFGFWHEQYGYDRMFAKEHPDFPNAIYDIGERNQPYGEDYVDTLNDSVYAKIGVSAGVGEANVRYLLHLWLDGLEDGIRYDTGSYDYLRQHLDPIDDEVPLYYAGVVLWDGSKQSFTGQSGAICNTTLSFSTSGNYLLWVAYDDVHSPYFNSKSEKVPIIFTAPVHFYVSPFPG